MLEMILGTYKTVLRLMKQTWLKMLILWGIITVAALLVNLLIPRLSALIIGHGFNPLQAPSFIWSQSLARLLEEGTTVFKTIGFASFFFQGLYGAFEFIVHNSLLSLFAGFYTYYALGALRENDFGLRSMVKGFRPSARYMMGMWFIILILVFAGGIGAIEQAFYNTQPGGDALSMLAAWTIVGSVAVFGLCILFIRLSLLPYVRCVSNERFSDSVRFTFHLTSGSFWVIIVVMIPVVLLSYALFYYTRSIEYVGTICQQIGIIVVVIIEASLFHTLTEKKDQKKTSIATERLG